MKKMTVDVAILLLVVGVVLGSIFTFGMQFWSNEPSYEDCTHIKTEFLSYKEIKRHGHIQEIAIDCANGERYFIDGATINDELKTNFSKLSKNDTVSIVIHPESEDVLEFSSGAINLLSFKDSIRKINVESDIFLILGIFMYICAIFGLCRIIIILKNKKQ